MSKKDQEKRIQAAEKQLTALLNYGGIYVNGGNQNRHIALAYQEGDLSDEVGQMRDLATAFSELADALEDQNPVEGSLQNEPLNIEHALRKAGGAGFDGKASEIASFSVKYAGTKAQRKQLFHDLAELVTPYK